MREHNKVSNHSTDNILLLHNALYIFCRAQLSSLAVLKADDLGYDWKCNGFRSGMYYNKFD
jgi:hypothetical protein